MLLLLYAIIPASACMLHLIFHTPTSFYSHDLLCIPTERGADTVSLCDGDNEDQMYEQVDEKQHHTGAVAMKHNEAYRQLQISSSSPTITTGL